MKTLVGCKVYHLACTAQPKCRTGMGKVFTLARVGQFNIVQMRKLHRKRKGATGHWTEGFSPSQPQPAPASASTTSSRASAMMFCSPIIS